MAIITFGAEANQLELIICNDAKTDTDNKRTQSYKAIKIIIGEMLSANRQSMPFKDLKDFVLGGLSKPQPKCNQ